MATKEEIENFLQDFKQKMKVFDVLFRDDRGKNAQTLADLEIRPIDRNTSLENLCADDYCEGPLAENLYGGLDMWVFGKEIKKNEVYIKISIGFPNQSVICISFHIAEHPLNYPLKGAAL
jgi:hypothetical protein